MDLQALMDGMSMHGQRARAKSQMTLGGLIEALEAMPEGMEVENLRNEHSYRGYYMDLSFEQKDGKRLASELLADCKAAMGKVYEGYKGGDFVMGALTPLWIASYGCTGLKLIDMKPDGTIETMEDCIDT